MLQREYLKHGKVGLDDEYVGELVEVFTDDLGAALRELVVNAAVVLLVGVQLAEVHGLDQARTSSEE